MAIHSPFTLSEHLRNACFFYVVGELRTKAEEGMFVSYNLAGVELSQTHCVLHTCAVFSPCFSQGFPLLFIYIFVLTALGLHCCTFSAAVSGGCSLWGVCGLLIGVASLVEGMGSRMCGLQWLWHMGLVAWRHVGSSWTRDRMHVSCTGRKILNH